MKKIYKVYSSRTNGTTSPLLQLATEDKKQALKLKSEIDLIMGLCAWIEESKEIEPATHHCAECSRALHSDHEFCEECEAERNV